ncbi:translocation/assembly module TamB domain-containing protein [Chachezhania antarctica]|mgnify:CR=1 FL=1|uniref:translocation/assembly module TamB domain-containing protein n=1 Tax=Chachezhania antarctica TaxID=2340860 RepID=UPI000EAEB084|nr:translocation/assembly module TamB domain-containing protein [Chachezhania antarctica]
MRRFIRYFALATGLMMLSPAVAQNADDSDDAGGFLVRTLESLASGENRQVRVVGLSGALSSRATIERIEVSDDDGPWLTLRNVVLDWNRLALVRRRFSVNALTAEEIDFARLPTPVETDPELPTAEAQPFSIPELPVAVNIGEISTEKLTLGEPVMGIAATLSLDGKLDLANGGLNVQMEATRLDSAGDQLKFVAAYAPQGQEITVDVEVNEASGGLLSSMMGIPGAPALSLTAKGTGPVENFNADIALSTDNTDRVTGTVALSSVASGAQTDAPQGGITFTADLGGDVASLVAEEYKPFFGPDTQLHVEGLKQGGDLNVNTAEIKTQALDLTASLGLSDGQLNHLEARGRIEPPDATSVVLPIGAPPVSIAGANLSVTLTDNTRWQAEITASGIDREGLALERAEIIAGGDLKAKSMTPDADEPLLSGSLRATLTGLDLEDDGLSAALGDTAVLRSNFSFGGADYATLDSLDFKIADYGMTGDIAVRRKEGGLVLDGGAQLDIPDLSRFAKLAGRPIDGSAQVSVKGTAEPLADSFDVTVSGETTDLDVGIPDLVPLLKGTAELDIAAARDTTGTHLRTFTLKAPSFDASANGSVSSTNTDLALQAKLEDLGLLVPSISGPVTLDGAVKQAEGTWSGDLSVTAPNDSTIELSGSVPPEGAAQITAKGNVGALPGLVPEELTPIEIDGEATRPATQDAGWTGELNVTAGEGLQALIEGTVDALGQADVTLSATADDKTGMIPEEFAPVALAGRLQRATSGIWQTDVTVTAADAVRATLKGEVGENGTADLDLNGALPFLDTTLPPAMTPVAFSGTATRTEDGQLDARLELDGNGSAMADVEAEMTPDGILQVEVNGQVPSGSGLLPAELEPVTLTANARRRDGVATAQGELTGGAAGSFTFTGRHTAEDGANLTLLGTLKRVEGMIPDDIAPLSLKADFDTDPDQTWTATAHVTGAERIVLHVDGSQGADGLIKGMLDGEIAVIGDLIPASMGPIKLTGQVNQTRAGGWTTKMAARGPRNSALTVDGALNSDGSARISYDARITELQRLLEDFSGTLTSKGQAQLQNGQWRIDTDLSGPGGITSGIAGTYNMTDNRANITAQGQAPLAIANIFITPNSLSGLLNYRLTLNGTPSLDAIAGTITTEGATAAFPAAGQLVEDLRLNVTLNNGSAVVAASASLGEGGDVTVRGPIELLPPFNANLAIALNELGLTNNINVQSSASGQLSLTGPLTGGAQIAGTVNFGETNIDLAATGAGLGLTPIPEITHVGESGAVYQTLVFADLIQTGEESPPVVYGLNIQLNAPNRVFVRGRGVDAELGGSMRIEGTTANVIPTGRISLIRGVVDVLGRPLRLNRGEVSLRGSFTPYIEFVATTNTSEGSATLSIEGALTSPEIVVTSSPERPQDEALAMLVFGENFADISPLRLAQMAASIARAGGITGDGVTNQVREATGVDSIRTGSSGGLGALTTGGYIADNVYSDVTVNTEGDTELNLNLDVTPSVTLRGRVDNTGEGGIGLFYERDY